MLRFAEAYPEVEIVSTLSRQLAWSHFLELIYLKDPLQRNFYTQMCSQERWSVRRLRERKDTLLFERTALSRQPEELLATEWPTCARTAK
jgi:predicted nuclease of restriction endonuclease-like (RecB) superfamily